ncbi:unnamed protein product [Brassica rapa subsp. trilocularis]
MLIIGGVDDEEGNDDDGDYTDDDFDVKQHKLEIMFTNFYSLALVCERVSERFNGVSPLTFDVCTRDFAHIPSIYTCCTASLSTDQFEYVTKIMFVCSD